MSAQTNAPVIIKRKKVVSGGDHHGGAWKVAYADFVTAMMAFFMLMWLLNATTEQQRKGLADYFSPTVPVSRISGGGEDMFQGQDMFVRDSLVREGSGGTAGDPVELILGDSGEGLSEDEAAEVAALEEIEATLLGRGGESLVSELALRHVVTRVTDEGLVIEIFARPGAPIFADGSLEPMPVTREIVAMIARVAGHVTNRLSVSAHLPAQPVILAETPVWALSAGRADAVRRLLEAAGLDPARVQRLTGHGDRSPVSASPVDVRNDRIEITLLRSAAARR